MTVVTTLVIYGVTYLTGKIAEVLLVLWVILGIGPNVLMAVLALRGILIRISASSGTLRTVQFLAVTFGAGHCFLCPVDIGGHPFVIPEVFVADTGPMTGCTVVLH